MKLKIRATKQHRTAAKAAVVAAVVARKNSKLFSKLDNNKSNFTCKTNENDKERELVY